MSASTQAVDVLVVGAGPTGLVLALWLRRLGVRVRVIDKVAEPGTTSRALAVQARILEQYDQLGLADAVIAHGLKMEGANFWVRGKHIARAPLADIGAGLSKFPFVVIYPQDEHERFLIDRLRAAGVAVERPVELLRFEASAEGVRAWLRDEDGAEQQCDCTYLAGCDGARSRVREVLGVGFPGGSYSHLFYVADVEGSGPAMNKELHVALDEADFLGLFPLAGEGRARLIGTVRQDAAEAQRPVTWQDVGKGILQRMSIEVARVNWFSTYHVHHRVAQQFRRHRAFLLGDAAHIHSPVGGQGMNTGIGDAINLSWKLAAVLRGAADSRILDSYEYERMRFANRLVETTDRIFTFVTRDGSLARFMRLNVAPRAIPLAFRTTVFRRFMFRTISQLVVEYRGSPLSQGKTGEIEAGDRLPWVAMSDGELRDNYAPLKSVDWQVHIYGEAADDIGKLCTERALALHAFAWRGDMQRHGIARNAVYLVRPDGYVALADAEASPATLQSYLDARAIRPVSATAVTQRTAAAPPG